MRAMIESIRKILQFLSTLVESESERTERFAEERAESMRDEFAKAILRRADAEADLRRIMMSGAADFEEAKEAARLAQDLRDVEFVTAEETRFAEKALAEARKRRLLASIAENQERTIAIAP
jgi:hypothetical protein